jgi:hypothetical protein
MSISSFTGVLTGLLLVPAIAALSNGTASTPTPTYPFPSGYSAQVYNISAATTTLTYNYSNEELAMLWNQVGSTAVGPITSTVSPTPEPSGYPQPGEFHPLVRFDERSSLYGSNKLTGSIIRHISQLFKTTRRFHLGLGRKLIPDRGSGKG